MPYTVATAPTAQLTDYLSWDTVWFFHGPYNYAYASPESDSRLEAWFNFDWETIAQQALESGHCSGASLHVVTAAGWRGFFSGETMPPYIDSVNYPVYGQDYGIMNAQVEALGVTVDHVYKFVKAFRSRGMKVGFYIQEHQARQLMSYSSPNYNETATSRLVYLNYLKREAKWLNAMYAPDFWWCDHPSRTSWSLAQRDELYQALKGPQAALIIHNALDYTITFPCDVLQAEHPNGMFANDGQYVPATVVSGTTYYMPKGVCFTGLYYTSTPTPGFPYLWGAVENATPDGVTTYNLVRDQAWFNNLYKFCKDRGMPAFISMPALSTGLIPDYLDRVTNLDAS